MGFFGGDNDTTEPTRGEELADEQLQMNKEELENKKQNLYATRLDIIRSQGAEQWTPDYGKRAPLTPNRGSFPAGMPDIPKGFPFPWGRKHWA